MTSGPAGGGAGLAARRAALRAVADVEVDGAWSTRAVPDRVADLPTARDRALASQLAYDTIRWAGTLDWALGLVLSRPIDQVEPSLRRVLRMGALQLVRMRVPDRAVVDTAVSLAREAVPRGRAKGAAGFVNGVLRSLSRRIDAEGDLPWPDGDDPAAVGLRTAQPEWIVSAARRRFAGDAESVLHADNRPPGLTLRSNASVEALVAELREAGVDAHLHPEVPGAVTAPGADPRRLDAVREGRATPQDAASILVGLAVDAQPGDRCLDLCAGPGGKATQVAHAVGPDGSVTAVELHEHRARLVDDAARRQGLNNVSTHVGDALALALEPHDRVLLDAPCSGLGVGRRRPEVRWRRSPDDVTALAELQRGLLVRAASLVKPGGRLVYAVCTWTVEETVGVVAHDDVRAALADFVELEQRQLRPDLDQADGMFIARWDRR